MALLYQPFRKLPYSQDHIYGGVLPHCLDCSQNELMTLASRQSTSQDRVWMTTEEPKTNHNYKQINMLEFNHSTALENGDKPMQLRNDNYLSPRSYEVETTDGQTYRRNRINLRPNTETLLMPHITHKTIRKEWNYCKEIND